jgi:putative nucleotidyltransferase with HDIG domain
MTFYINGIALAGLLVALLALTDLPADRAGLAVFAALAAVAELTNVSLFTSSRSRISISSIVAIASILAFGPLAGVLTHAAIGIMTLITTSLGGQPSPKGRVSGVQRAAFNAGMLVIATAVSGWTFVALNGQVGEVVWPGNLLPLLVASTLDVSINLALLIGVIALQTGQRPADIWHRDFAWSAPISILGGALGAGFLATAYAVFGLFGLAVFFVPVLATSYSYRLYIHHTRRYVDQLEEMNRNLDELNMSLLETLSSVIDADDIYTSNHSTYVAEYTEAIARKMNLPYEEQLRVKKAALVHDIGKVGVKDSIIGKQGRLSDEEYNIVKRHPVIGAEIIGRMKGFQSLVPLVRHHHERWDGKGYPDGLKGEEIPLGTRIIALADALDSMLSDRPYRATRSFRDILDEIERCSGSQFDPAVVKAFFEVVEEQERGFFKNSAALVDRAVLLSGMEADTTDARYLKKSMLER